jgi:hypothetical protein
MLRAERLLPQRRLLTLRFSVGCFQPAPGACYPAPWRLPGPDLHRLANTCLYGTAPLLSLTSLQDSPFSGHASGPVSPDMPPARNQAAALEAYEQALQLIDDLNERNLWTCETATEVALESLTGCFVNKCIRFRRHFPHDSAIDR